MGKNKDGKYIPPKGKPSGTGLSKAGLKTIPHIEDLDKHDEIADKYTDGPDEPAANIRVSNPNRTVDKPEIDKPAYGGSH